MSKVVIYRADSGEYRGRLLDDDGRVVPIKGGSTGLKRTAKQRAEDRSAVQAGLKALFERQQAGQNGA